MGRAAGRPVQHPPYRRELWYRVVERTNETCDVFWSPSLSTVVNGALVRGLGGVGRRGGRRGGEGGRPRPQDPPLDRGGGLAAGVGGRLEPAVTESLLGPRAFMRALCQHPCKQRLGVGTDALPRGRRVEGHRAGEVCERPPVPEGRGPRQHHVEDHPHRPDVDHVGVGHVQAHRLLRRPAARHRLVAGALAVPEVHAGDQAADLGRHVGGAAAEASHQVGLLAPVLAHKSPGPVPVVGEPKVADPRGVVVGGRGVGRRHQDVARLQVPGVRVSQVARARR
mmetsp:Transcript_25163/g.58290  ORF Transcript_25163/g.58290 Transcript_25163/m.58290 type:complete len:281 (+) Transcript_25163:185-1027(+)